MQNTTWIFIFILIFVLLRKRRNRKIAAAIWQMKRNQKERTAMRELAKQFVGKECLIYQLNDSNVTATIREISENGLLVENKQGLQIVNLDYVVRIQEYPRRKDGKKKSIFVAG